MMQWLIRIGTAPQESVAKIILTPSLALRDVKTTLGMEILRGQSPDIVRKEIAMHLHIYNLVRMVMLEAARRHGRS